MNMVDKSTDDEAKEDIIIKYLTDSLDESEQQRFRKLIASDESFRTRLTIDIATLAISDSALTD